MASFLSQGRSNRRGTGHGWQSTSQTSSSQASFSNAPSTPSIHHQASSRTLEKARATVQSPSPTPHLVLRERPPGVELNAGISFPIDWGNIWLGRQKLVGERLGYRVKHTSQLRGNRARSLVWKHGADLAYTEKEGKLVKLWLCKLCHLTGV
jgi:hypothetical protein